MPNANKIIRQARQAAGLTQTELADRLGLLQKTISEWETGVHRCAADTLYRIADACGVSIMLTADGWRLLLNLDHFLDLARCGRLLGATGSERNATELAFAILDRAPGLDAKAIDGLHQFIDAVIAAPTTARDLIR